MTGVLVRFSFSGAVDVPLEGLPRDNASPRLSDHDEMFTRAIPVSCRYPSAAESLSGMIASACSQIATGEMESRLYHFMYSVV